MNYDGHVQPGGDVQVHEVGNARVHKRSVGTMNNNAYLVESAGEALLIDAAADWRRLQEMIEQSAARVVGIATTHRHHDHVGALAEAVEALGVPTYAGVDDADAIAVPTTHRVEDGDTVQVGDLVLTAIHLRGHTPGSIALWFTDADGKAHLFSGDSLFPGGVGATNHYEYQSFTQLIDDVEEKVFGRFGDDTRVYPGHGDDTTVGAERPSLGEWRARGW